jgi:hypothetical protein
MLKRYVIEVIDIIVVVVVSLFVTLAFSCVCLFVDQR